MPLCIGRGKTRACADSLWNGLVQVRRGVAIGCKWNMLSKVPGGWMVEGLILLLHALLQHVAPCQTKERTHRNDRNAKRETEGKREFRGSESEFAERETEPEHKCPGREKERMTEGKMS